MADTGDLLLFKSNVIAGRLQRRALGSQFDHVAMLLKFETDDNQLYFVEATGNYGVAMNTWQEIKKHVGENKFY